MKDSGLQPERTWLAWVRTGVTMMVNGGLVLRAGLVSNNAPLAWTGALLLRAGFPRPAGLPPGGFAYAVDRLLSRGADVAGLPPDDAQFTRRRPPALRTH